jgi:hypothetical protein
MAPKTVSNTARSSPNIVHTVVKMEKIDPSDDHPTVLLFSKLDHISSSSYDYHITNQGVFFDE